MKNTTKKLFFQALIKYLSGLLLVSLLLFVPAGTLKFWNAWLFISLLFIPMFIVGIILIITNPELLSKRLNIKETEKDQKQVIIYSSIMFLSGFIIAGLNFKYKWFELPKIVIIISSIIFVISYILYAEVLRENAHLSRTIEVEKNQKIVDTGLYGIVRHPMYAITIILFLVIPLILDSPISFVIFLLYPIIISKRIKNEELILEKELKGYQAYKQKVKYKIIPYIW